LKSKIFKAYDDIGGHIFLATSQSNLPAQLLRTLLKEVLDYLQEAPLPRRAQRVRRA